MKINLLKKLNVFHGNNTDSIALAHQLHDHINSRCLSKSDKIKSGIAGLMPNHGIYESYLFPVERTSIYTFAWEIGRNKLEVLDKIQSLNEIQNIEFKIDEIFNSRKRYTQVINEKIREAQDLLHISSNAKSEFYVYAERIEEQILNGKIQIHECGSVFFVEQGKNQYQPFDKTKSSFKNLASILIYLKYQAKKNQLMIIEEPENGLDKKSIVMLTSVLNELLENGVKLLIITNENYIKKNLKKI